jgi:hypothetical protein
MKLNITIIVIDGTQTSKPRYGDEDVTVLWNQAVHTDRQRSYSK